MTTTNTYGRQVVIPLTNKSGGSVAAGDVVIIDTGNNDAFTTTTSANATGGLGIAQETIANNATGRVLLSGYAALVNVNASVTRGHFGATYTVAKQATDVGASRQNGTAMMFLTGGTTPDAIVWQPDITAAGTALVGAQYERTSGSYTTTSTTFVAVDSTNLKFTLTTGAHHVLIGLTGAVSHGSSGVYIPFDIAVDGTRLGGGNYGLNPIYPGLSGTLYSCAFTAMTAALSAGSHTFELQWRTDAGTATLHGLTGADSELIYWAAEQPF